MEISCRRINFKSLRLTVFFDRLSKFVFLFEQGLRPLKGLIQLLMNHFLFVRRRFSRRARFQRHAKRRRIFLRLFNSVQFVPRIRKFRLIDRGEIRIDRQLADANAAVLHQRSVTTKSLESENERELAGRDRRARD